MIIETHIGLIQLINEPTYSIGSTDNTHIYPLEYNLTPAHRPSSAHGLLVDGSPLAVLANAGGASGIHDHSAVLIRERLYLAVGDRIAALRLSPFQMAWSLKVDDAACFGVYYNTANNTLVSHGELSITRFSLDGDIIWRAYGADIFSEGFSLQPEHVEAIDFEHRVYKFSYHDGMQIA